MATVSNDDLAAGVSVDERLAFGRVRQTLLAEELMGAAASYIQDRYADRSEFILARCQDRDEYEPWFEICLPDGIHLRVNVELRAL